MRASVNQPLNKRQRQAQDTRLQLLDAARAEFELKGYSDTTVAAITARADTAHGTFYLYFKNKEDVFSEVISSSMEAVYNASAARWDDRSPEEILHESLSQFVRHFGEHPGLWRSILEAILQSEQVEQRWRGIRRRFVDRISERLRGMQEAGMIGDRDTELVAHLGASMVEWFCYTHFVFDQPGQDAVDTDRLLEVLADTYGRTVFGGLRRPSNAAPGTIG